MIRLLPSAYAFALALAIAGTARGQPAPRAEVLLIAPERSRRELSASLRELGSEVDAEVALRSAARLDLRAILSSPAPEDAGLLARAWLRVAPPEALLVLSDASGERLLLRRIDIGPHLDPVEVESLAQIMASSLEALRLGGEIGVTRSEVAAVLPPASPEPPAVAAAPRMTTVPAATHAPLERHAAPLLAELEVSEQASLWSLDERPEHRVSLRGVLGLRRRWHPALLLELGYLVPSVVGQGDVGARLEGLALRAGVGLRRGLGRASLRARATAGLDLLHVEPRLLGPSSLRVEPARWTTLAMLEVAAGVGYRVLPRASLFMDVGVSVDLADARYTVERGDAVATSFDPYRARTFVTLGLRVALEDPR